MSKLSAGFENAIILAPHGRFLALISFVASCMSYWNYWISWYVWRLKIPVAFNVDCGWKSRNRAIHGSVCKSIWGFARVESDWLEFRKSREVLQIDAFVTSKSFCTRDFLGSSEYLSSCHCQSYTSILVTATVIIAETDIYVLDFYWRNYNMFMALEALVGR